MFFNCWLNVPFQPIIAGLFSYSLERDIESQQLITTGAKSYSFSELRENIVDVSIASLYVISGLPCMSERVQAATDLSASSLWLLDSLILLGFSVRKYYKYRKNRS